MTAIPSAKTTNPRKGRWTLAGRWVTTLEDVCAVRREALNDPEKAYLIPQCDSLISMIKADMGIVMPPYAVVPPVCIDGEDDELPF